MDITTDVILAGPSWDFVIEKLKGNIFETQWQIYALCVSIGIKDDRKEASTSDGETKNYIPRTVLNHPENSALLEMMFQSAILTTKQLQLDENTRLELAFEDRQSSEKQFNKIGLLTEFANYGVVKIKDCISAADNDMETMSSLKDYLEKSYIDALNGDVLTGSPEDYELSD